MDQYKNNKGFLKCFLAGMFIVTFICLIHLSGGYPGYGFGQPGYGYPGSYTGYGFGGALAAVMEWKVR